MSHFSLYSNETGLFTGAVIVCQLMDLDGNVPDGHGCIMGDYDQLSQRVDLETGVVIDYQPPQPSANHEWDAGARRWRYVPTAGEVCAANRRAAYPPLADLADALYWQAQGAPEKMEAYLAACRAVKETYPKP